MGRCDSPGAMARYDAEVLRATAARDDAVLRSRKLTAGVVAATAGLAAVFAALAAGATHPRKFVHVQTVRARARRGPVVAPAAPLVAVETHRTPAPPPSPPAAAPPPPAAAPPVAISGGS
jgi:hypothetical protein